MNKFIRSILKFFLDKWLLIVIFPFLLFVLLAFLAPVVHRFGNPNISRFIYFGYSFTCHQLPRRSLFINGYKMAFCARDFALYGSFVAGTFLRAIIKKNLAFKYYLLFLLPMFIDGTTQLAGLRESTNMLRLISGTIAGVGSAFFFLPYIEKAVNKAKEEFPN